ncbi:F-box/kelch-repeat protein At3g23880-like isoform X2 [Vicia villosa]|uniref:F-box/kelch-repeat protein At3g23880-like isoform X2 n=1 Tax=Vicia villosa TaxID=3911 RepID=UPI00273B2503|nr:F-box/kelch-repeat protein At3g23880-like isoform X2 [Vicia villosa]
MSSSPLFISDDLIYEVLSLLKVKSVLRFRCVSKNWDTLISDPTFVKLHQEKSAKQNPHFLLITEHKTHIQGESPYDSDDECEYECGVIPYSVSSLLENPSFDLSVDSYYLVQHKGCSNIVGSYNGLICLSGESYGREYYECWFRLWNPATQATSPKLGFLRLFHNRPGCAADNGYFNFTFGYDNSTGTYKIFASRYVFRKRRSEVKILCLGDDVWRDIQTFPVEPLYYCKTETYNQYSLPPEFDQVPPRAPIIAVLGDCLSFSYFSYETELIIWQMKKFGVEDSWSQFLKISCHSLQIHYDYSEYMLFFFELVPLFLSKDGDTLILKCFQEDQEILYNRRNNTVVRTKITATTTTTDDRTVHSISCTANDHIESLVSVFLKS